jgi:hypothetical protein
MVNSQLLNTHKVGKRLTLREEDLSNDFCQDFINMYDPENESEATFLNRKEVSQVIHEYWRKVINTTRKTMQVIADFIKEYPAIDAEHEVHINPDTTFPYSIMDITICKEEGINPDIKITISEIV